MEKLRLRWYEHVKRMEEERLPRIMENLAVAGSKPKVLSRQRWIDNLKRYVTEERVPVGIYSAGGSVEGKGKWRGTVPCSRWNGHDHSSRRVMCVLV